MISGVKLIGQAICFTNPKDTPTFGTGSGKPFTTSQKSTFAFKLDDETETKLRIFKQQLEKKMREPKDWNEVMKELLEIAAQHTNCALKLQKKEHPAAEKADPLTAEEIKKTLPAVSTRHIPARVKKYLKQKYSGKCGFPACKYPADIDHHIKRFSLHPSHDLNSIVPLCKNHGRIAHHGLIKNENRPPENWKIRTGPDKNCLKYIIDKKVRKFRANRINV